MYHGLDFAAVVQVLQSDHADSTWAQCMLAAMDTLPDILDSTQSLIHSYAIPHVRTSHLEDLHKAYF